MHSGPPASVGPARVAPLGEAPVQLAAYTPANPVQLSLMGSHATCSSVNFLWASSTCRSKPYSLFKMPHRLQGVLEPEEVEALASAWHPPSFALAVLSELVAAAGAPAGGPGVAAVPTVGPAAGLGLRDTQLTRLDESLSELEGALGACEKILRTPIPLSCEPSSQLAGWRAGAAQHVLHAIAQCGRPCLAAGLQSTTAAVLHAELNWGLIACLGLP